jgi:very-short-patch-repair endonuclease
VREKCLFRSSLIRHVCRCTPVGKVFGQRNSPLPSQAPNIPEVKLWVRLREWKRLGFHFRRQAPIGPYIVDFVSFRSRLVIEADGGQHGMSKGVESDRSRDDFLRSQGFQVLRFWNSDIDANLEGVLETIFSALKKAE